MLHVNAVGREYEVWGGVGWRVRFGVERPVNHMRVCDVHYSLKSDFRKLQSTVHQRHGMCHGHAAFITGHAYMYVCSIHYWSCIHVCLQHSLLVMHTCMPAADYSVPLQYRTNVHAPLHWLQHQSVATGSRPAEHSYLPEDGVGSTIARPGSVTVSQIPGGLAVTALISSAEILIKTSSRVDYGEDGCREKVSNPHTEYCFREPAATKYRQLHGMV